MLGRTPDAHPGASGHVLAFPWARLSAWVRCFTLIAEAPSLFAGHHGDGLAFEVDVRVAADVDGDAVDGAAGERPGHGAGVVVGDGLAAVTADAEALAGDGELAGLGLDPAFADLVVAVVQGQDAGRRRRAPPRRPCRRPPTGSGSPRWAGLRWRRPSARGCRRSCRRSAAGCPSRTGRGRRTGRRGRTARPAHPGSGRSTSAPIA